MSDVSNIIKSAKENLERQFETFHSDFSRTTGVLRSKIQELTDKNTSLTSQQSEIDENVVKLVTKISTLKRQKENLQKSIDENNEELADLKKELDNFERKFTNLSINHSVLSGAGTAEGNICKKCVLPYDQIERFHSVITTCGHQFCQKCLKQLFTLNNPFNFPINQEISEASCPNPTCNRSFAQANIIKLN
ncbi:Oidioi.mRNA.OKI2018_I69.chr1.g2127.t1.cds [Oikopleura dioica]|uniref:Oidioi.mRNA.OKI2018_I69.chr1.g2127.t1.cds n=1 Tax=Oikopleura dioica TaxID=34765 RepID=A0ABN7SZ83_OIKDI|nr:Oidioi.mRNA.OKI2018_I69.chr1.g2127.t1.cds [Oikopleura dioica]